MTDLEGLIAEQRGFFFRWQVKDLNYSDSEIEDHLRGKDWVKLRRGTYALAAQVDGLAAHERHVLVARSVVARLTPPAVLTHYSALALQGVPLWGVDLGEVTCIEDRTEPRGGTPGSSTTRVPSQTRTCNKSTGSS